MTLNVGTDCSINVPMSLLPLFFVLAHFADFADNTVNDLDITLMVKPHTIQKPTSIGDLTRIFYIYDRFTI